MIMHEIRRVGASNMNYYFSDRRMMIENNGKLYSEIYLPENKTANPTETEIPIEEDSEI